MSAMHIGFLFNHHGGHQVAHALPVALALLRRGTNAKVSVLVSEGCEREVRRMAADLCLGVDVRGVETVRDPDGLALSSRNQYLTDDDRRVALALSRALRAAQERASYGLPAARWAAMKVLTGESGLDLDYLALRGADLSELPDYPETTGRVLVAARVGNTRLIDNMPIEFTTRGGA